MFEKHDNEFLNFSKIENKRSTRPDLHAFLLLDALVPGTTDIISAAEHDEFYLSIDPDDLAKSGITEEQVIELTQCGIRLGSEGLCMFA